MELEASSLLRTHRPRGCNGGARKKMMDLHSAGATSATGPWREAMRATCIGYYISCSPATGAKAHTPSLTSRPRPRRYCALPLLTIQHHNFGSTCLGCAGSRNCENKKYSGVCTRLLNDADFAAITPHSPSNDSNQSFRCLLSRASTNFHPIVHRHGNRRRPPNHSSCTSSRPLQQEVRRLRGCQPNVGFCHLWYLHLS